MLPLLRRGRGVIRAAPAGLAGFEAFIRDCAPDLLSFFLRRVYPPEGAGDCLGEVLLILWKRADAFPSDLDQQRAWAFGIAHHVLLNHRRGERRRLNLVNELRNSLRDTDVRMHESSSDLVDALARLKTTDRDLLLLVAWEGFSVADAGKIVGLRSEAARARYSRTRARLRVDLAGVR